MLQRTARARPGPYIDTMMIKAFSYLMIGVFASGLAMTVAGSVGVLAGL